MFTKLRQRVRSVLQRTRFERELDTELQFHVDMLTAQYVGRGLSPEAARQAALHAFGPVAGVKDHVRDTWLSRVLESAMQDVRYGLRALAAAPAFTLGVILTMALAVGVNTAIFGVTYSILLKPLPFDSPDRLVTLQHVTPQSASNLTFSVQELADYRRVPSLESVAELHTMWFILLGRPSPERVSTGVVSTNYFDLLGVKPMLGRGLLASDDAAGAPAVLLLSHEFWTRSTDSDPTIVGRIFEMNDRPHTVVGVLPPFPDYPQKVDVYMPTSACPFRSNPNVAAGRTMRMVRGIARVRDGVSSAQLADDLALTSATLERAYPDVYIDNRTPAGSPVPYRATALGLADDMRAPMRSTLLLLVATAALVLMLACVSVSNLTLARLTHRAGEVSLRAALGATRQRLLRQLLTENATVAVFGAVAGLLLAHLALGCLDGLRAAWHRAAGEQRLDVRRGWLRRGRIDRAAVRRQHRPVRDPPHRVAWRAAASAGDPDPLRPRRRASRAVLRPDDCRGALGPKPAAPSGHRHRLQHRTRADHARRSELHEIPEPADDHQVLAPVRA